MSTPTDPQVTVMAFAPIERAAPEGETPRMIYREGMGWFCAGPNPEQPQIAIGGMLGWKHIETAPRDGTRILVTEMCYGGAPDGLLVSIASYCEPLWEGDGPWREDNGQVAKPLHWMPLPKPPEL